MFSQASARQRHAAESKKKKKKKDTRKSRKKNKLAKVRQVSSSKQSGKGASKAAIRKSKATGGAELVMKEKAGSVPKQADSSQPSQRKKSDGPNCSAIAAFEAWCDSGAPRSRRGSRRYTGDLRLEMSQRPEVNLNRGFNASTEAEASSKEWSPRVHSRCLFEG